MKGITRSNRSELSSTINPKCGTIRHKNTPCFLGGYFCDEQVGSTLGDWSVSLVGAVSPRNRSMIRKGRTRLHWCRSRALEGPIRLVSPLRLPSINNGYLKLISQVRLIYPPLYSAPQAPKKFPVVTYRYKLRYLIYPPSPMYSGGGLNQTNLIDQSLS